MWLSVASAQFGEHSDRLLLSLRPHSVSTAPVPRAAAPTPVSTQGRIRRCLGAFPSSEDGDSAVVDSSGSAFLPGAAAATLARGRATGSLAACSSVGPADSSAATAPRPALP